MTELAGDHDRRRTDNFMYRDQQIDNGEPEQPTEQTVYAIDTRAFEASGRSFQYAVFSRLCNRGHCSFCEGGKASPANMGTPSEMMKAIGSECSNEPDFLLPGTPITEAVFRIMIKRNNKPMTLEEVQSELTAAWASVIYLKNLSEDVLRRLLEGQNEYYIVPVGVREASGRR